MFASKDIEYAQGGKPHIDIDKELPADIHHTVTGFFSSPAWYLENECCMNNRQKELAASFSKYRNQQNCERF